MKEKIESEYLYLQDLFSDSSRKSLPGELAHIIIDKEKIITLRDTKEVFGYNKQSGLYEPFEWVIKYICKFCRGQLFSTHFQNEVVEAIKAMSSISREEANPSLDLIPLDNGIFDFKQKKLVPYSPDFIFFSKHPIKHAESIQSQSDIGLVGMGTPIDKFLFQVVEKQEEVLFLKEFIGYCFYRAMPFHMIVILVGSGANGKSVFLQIVQKMIGEKNYCNRTLQDLSGEDKFSKADLYGKNVNIVGDLPSKALQDTGLLKLASGGDILNAQKKFKDSFEFKPYCKIVCAANEVPESPDFSTGFFRRMFIINFPNTFEGKENRNLINELCTQENMSAFFSSCIQAFSVVLEDNWFILRETIEQKKEKYLNYSNSAIAFCNQLLEYDPDAELSTQDIFEAYKSFCDGKKLIRKDERQFFVSLYRFFSNRVFKKRKSILKGAKETRYYVVAGVDWK